MKEYFWKKKKNSVDENLPEFEAFEEIEALVSGAHRSVLDVEELLTAVRVRRLTTAGPGTGRRSNYILADLPHQGLVLELVLLLVFYDQFTFF